MLPRTVERLLGTVAAQSGAVLARRGYLAAVVSEHGKIDIREMKKQSPHAGQILVEIESAGVNPADLRMINGQYHIKPKLPFVPGFEIAGNVTEVGKGVKRWKEGDRVAVLRSAATGGFAEECIIDTNIDTVIPLPYGVEYETAAAVATSYGTAYLALADMAKDRVGASLLVLSSRGMIAFAAVDLAQNLFKADVIACSDTEEKLDKLRETGVVRTVNYTKEKLVDVARKGTMGHGVDVVVDTIGGDVFGTALECIRPGGRVFSLGFTSGKIPSVSVLDLHRTGATVSGIWLGGRQPDEVEKTITMIFDLFQQEFLQARIDAKYQLKDVPQCIQDINDNKIFGKALINMKE